MTKKKKSDAGSWFSSRISVDTHSGDLGKHPLVYELRTISLRGATEDDRAEDSP
jgi:hypothetical protein